MDASTVNVWQDGSVLHIEFNRPDRLNAITPEMYEHLHIACDRADAGDEIRAVTIRGAGGKSFSVGSDINQLVDLRTGQDGARYEERLERTLSRIQRLSVPTVAIVQGLCVGAGLLIAGACDLRIATTGSRFALPVARTLGNCLSSYSLSLLNEWLGRARLMHMLLTARPLSADQALAAGLVSDVVEDDRLHDAVDTFVLDVLACAPLTIWSTKETLHRSRTRTLEPEEDVLTRVYESADFASGVAAFLDKRRAVWTGR